MRRLLTTDRQAFGCVGGPIAGRRTLNDRDYNDDVVAFSVPQPVPEPGTLLLLGSAMAALAARRKLAARKARQATV